MKKIINIYVQAADNSTEIPVNCRSSIEIIGKTVLGPLLKKLENFEINILGSRSDGNVINDFENLLVINTFDLVDFDLINKFSNKIYFFDDLDIWKIDNVEKYRNNLIFNYYLIPNENRAKELSNRLDGVHYMPYSSLDYVTESTKPLKSEAPSMFMDIWSKHRSLGSNRGELSLDKAVKFFNKISPLGLTVYVHESFQDEIFGPNIKYISDMPRMQFYDFIKSVWFYATSIMSSYEFIILEATINGALCVNIDHSVNIEHLKSRAVISDLNFFENYLSLIDQFSPIKNSESARLIYNNALYDEVLGKMLA